MRLVHREWQSSLIDGYDVGYVGRPYGLVLIHVLDERSAIVELQSWVVESFKAYGSDKLATLCPPSCGAGYVARIGLDEIRQVVQYGEGLVEHGLRSLDARLSQVGPSEISHQQEIGR